MTHSTLDTPPTTTSPPSTVPPEDRIGMWPWVGFVTLGLSLSLLLMVVGMAWAVGIGRRRRGQQEASDAERQETRALLAEAGRDGSQFSRF